MKKIICVLVILLSCFYANAQMVGFEYDDDGNMKLRKIITVGASTVKASEEQTISVEEKIDELKIIIYPNPTSGLFQVSISNIDSKQRNYYNIYSLNGSLLIKKEIDSSMTDIDISAFSKGTYLMDLFLGDKISRWKVIKK